MTLFDLGPIAPLQLHSESGPTPAKKATATVLPFAKKAKDQPRFAGAFSFAEPLGREGASDSGASRGAGGVGLSNASIRRLSCSDADSCCGAPARGLVPVGMPSFFSITVRRKFCRSSVISSSLIVRSIYLANFSSALRISARITALTAASRRARLLASQPWMLATISEPCLFHVVFIPGHETDPSWFLTGVSVSSWRVGSNWGNSPVEKPPRQGLPFAPPHLVPARQ